MLTVTIPTDLTTVVVREVYLALALQSSTLPFRCPMGRVRLYCTDVCVAVKSLYGVPKRAKARHPAEFIN